jgi:hypothetical protein
MFWAMRSISNMLSTLGSRSLDVHEWERAVIAGDRLKPNATWISLTETRAPLTLTGWRLAHAVVKADFQLAGDFGFSSIGFLFQMDRIIDFASQGNLRLSSGASASMSDVTHSSIAGRIGQGLSILFAQDRGYRYSCHLARLPEVQSWLASNSDASEKRVADFLFEDGSYDRMILESKATFTLTTDDPVSVKKILRPALLKQVEPWMTRLSPSATKGFAVYSSLREGGGAPSMIAFVDPEIEGPALDSVPPNSIVRRRNYAAWLAAMGFQRAAERLRGERSAEWSTGAESRLAVIEAGGRKFAVRVALDSFRIGSEPPVGVVEVLRLGASLSFARPSKFLVIGMEVKVARAIEQALRGDDGALLDYNFGELEDASIDQTRSVLSDGTFLGMIDWQEFGEIEHFEF